MCAALALSGCGSTDETAYRIGIVQQDEHSSLDAATQGFEDKLMELLGEENVTFDYQNAQGEQANSTTIATKFVSDGCDLILANGTTALQSAAAATADIPIVGTSVTDYIAAGAVNSNEKPGTNVTGVSDLGEIKAQWMCCLHSASQIRRLRWFTAPQSLTPSIRRSVRKDI